MARLTVAEAAEFLGVSRVTLYKYISLGRVSFQLDNNNNKTLDPSEVARLSETISVKNSKSAANKSERSLTVNDNNSLQAKINSLQALLDSKDAVIESKDQVIADKAAIIEVKDAMLAEKDKRLMLLEDLRQQAPGQPVAVPEQRQNPYSDKQGEARTARPPRGIGSRVLSAVWKELTRD